MTQIKVFFRDGAPKGLLVQGHSGYGPEGSDVVCAAVSVLVQTLFIGLVDVLHLAVEQRVNEDKALIELQWDHGDSRECLLLVETILKALKEIASSYRDYVSYLEVSDNAV